MFTHISSNADIRPSANPQTVLVLPLLACVLLAGLALGPVDTARAQTDDEPTMPTVFAEEAPIPGGNSFAITSGPWRTYFGEHAAEVLRRTDPRAKQAALRDLIAVAANIDGNIDLSETLTPLVEIFEQDPEDHSLMALQALDLIGTEHSSESRYRKAMTEISQIAQKKSSDRIRAAATDILQDFNGEGENG